jgi:MT-A70
MIKAMKRKHSRKPDELYEIIEACSPSPYLELFARGVRLGWQAWGNQSDSYNPTWPTYSNHSQACPCYTPMATFKSTSRRQTGMDPQQALL